MEYPITWRWELNRIGEVAHAGDDEVSETLCGKSAAGPSLLHGPWFELRCPICEELRAGRIEVFYNPFAESRIRDQQIMDSEPDNPNQS